MARSTKPAKHLQSKIVTLRLTRTQYQAVEKIRKIRKLKKQSDVLREALNIGLSIEILREQRKA